MREADPVVRSSVAPEWHLGPIVDADARIDPPYDMWKDYLPSQLPPPCAVRTWRDGEVVRFAAAFGN